MWITYSAVYLCVYIVIVDSRSDLDCRKPEQIHVGLGDDVTEMVVMWSTEKRSPSWVEYSLIDGNNTRSSRSRVSELMTDSSKALRYVHNARLRDLESGRKYKYKVIVQCGEDLHSSSSDYSFKTIDNKSNRTMSVLVYGDMGTTSGSDTISSLEKEINDKKFEVIWHIGDIAYDLNRNGGKVGDDFMREIESLSANIPYMTAPGNHELYGDFHHYSVRFNTPRQKWPIPLNKMFFSYDIGLVHFISYNTEVYFTHDQNNVCEQYDWLLKDLIAANKNRHNRPWIVAMGHRPMYCSVWNSDDCSSGHGFFVHGWVRHGLEELFYSQGVDLILQAHEHEYERSWPMYQGQPTDLNYNNPRAPVHVISGAAGNREGKDKNYVESAWFASKKQSKFSNNSYGRLHALNRTHLLWEQVISSTRDVEDYFWLVQNHHGPFDKAVDCEENGRGSHHSCNCPFTFHYMTCIIVSSLALILILVTAIACCVRRCWIKWRTSRVVTRKNGYLLANRNIESLDDFDDYDCDEADNEFDAAILNKR